MARQALTAESALKIIQAMVLVTEAGTPYKGIEVTNISTVDGDGNAFAYPDGTEYAIVNLKAVNQYGLEQAVADYKAEDFQEACNHNLSISMSIEEADKLSKGVFGTLVCRQIALKDADGVATGEEALLPYRFTAMKAVEGKTFSFADMLTKTEGVPTES